MEKLRKGFIMLVLFGLVFVLTACLSDEEAFIQGKWGIGNAHYWSEWDFNNGVYYFSYTYTPQTTSYETGHYRVIEIGEDDILLELFDQEGSMDTIDEPVDLRIEFDSVGDMISISGKEYFRVSTASLEALGTSQAP